MAYKYAIYEKKDRIAYITINRPERMNALHPPALDEIEEIWNDFRDDPNVWIAIYTGVGDKAFCTGDDVKDMAERVAQGKPVPEPFPPHGFGGIINRFDCWKPIIAAVNGYALAGGLEVAIACDIIVAAEHARFGLPESRIGHLASSGVHQLPRQIPLKLAMDLILTGRHMTAQEAYRMGLVNEVVPMKDLMSAAERWAQQILECAPISVQAGKEAVIRGIELPLRAALSTRFPMQEQMLRSEDAKEGPTAFAEKRKPQWKAR